MSMSTMMTMTAVQNDATQSELTLRAAVDDISIFIHIQNVPETLLSSSIGMFLHVLFVAGPLDFWYWIRSSLKSVNGRTVVITGGASGIGKRLAELLAIRFGAKVAILDINEHGAQQTVDNIVGSGGIAQCWRCDISQVEEVNECARQIDVTFGNVDIIVCNAAVLYIGGMLDLTTAQMQNSLDVNVMGTINVCL
ncbi:hypothetical protein WUBG_13015 [Wuchereria bancrofti]|uniref:Oxidoreductase n=1 Tax=Wuchereria bancrofti TaxID=6293 RepID=J9AP57_WUCBA|nr:hypothetical protein WUBG_13015 [Wuchereria bancrofti]